jgi:DNA-binding NarL/FixJ family response regulator
MIRVAVVDSQPVVRWGMEQALNAAPDIAVVVSAAELAGLDVGRLDVLIVGISVRCDAAAAIVGEIAHHINVVVMRSDDNGADAATWAALGVPHFLRIGAQRDEITTAVRAAASGSGPLNRPADGSAQDLLSRRERQVIAHIGSGLTHEQTARRLGISRHTVDTYVKRIRAKLVIGNKAELTRFAIMSDATQLHDH